MRPKISEQAVLIGKQKSLVGIVTRMVPADNSAERPAIVILNTGIIHRVGHHRMYVDLSRELARAGYTVLRFDLSGIGDSDSRAEAMPPWHSVFADVAEAIDWMESNRGIRQFILVGLCSGADHALYCGSSDDRIVGLVLMDPTIPPTPRYYMYYYRRRLFRLRSWINALLGESYVWATLAEFGRTVFGARDAVDIARPGEPVGRAFLEPLYQRCVENKTHFLIILTAAQDTRHSYRDQLVDAFPDVQFGDLLRLEFLHDCDHTFSFESNRAQLTDLLLEWAEKAPFEWTRQLVRRNTVAMLWLFAPAFVVRFSEIVLAPIA